MPDSENARYLYLIHQDCPQQLRKRPAQLLAMAIVMLFLPLASTSEGSGGDVLFFAVINYGEEVTYEMYDPYNGMNTPVYTTPEYFWPGPSVSVDGRAAFPILTENGWGIQIIDLRGAKSIPVTIEVHPATSVYRLAWSLDGSLLAFISSPYDDQQQLSVWDGNTIIDLSQSAAISYSDLAWSTDGRLAFSVAYGPLPNSDPGEVYVWDGNAIINVSQSPTSDDVAPTWSVDGQLAFQSLLNDEFAILVWDGISVKNGAPDADTFINVAPGLTAYYSFPSWTNTGNLAFVATGPLDNRHAQIYLWDGQTVTNLSQNLTLHNGCPRWNVDGQWAFATFFSAKQLLYVRDAENRTLLTVEGAYCPAWSADGFLVFCTYDRSDWVFTTVHI